MGAQLILFEMDKGMKEIGWLGLALQMEALKSTDLFSNSYDIHPVVS